MVMKRSPAPSDIAAPSNMVTSFPEPIMVTSEIDKVMLSSVIPEPQVPGPTYIVPPHTGNCATAYVSVR